MAEAKGAQGAADQDPSMEEILQSIRRIIAEDEKDDADTGEKMASRDSDVLELTEMIQEDGSVVSLNAADAPAPAAEESAAPVAAAAPDVLATIDSVLSEEVLAQELPAATLAPVPDIEELKPAIDEDALLSEKAAADAAAAMRKMSRNKPRRAPATPDIPVSLRAGVTLEDMVTDMIKPLLKEWLDSNLPALVERIVEREVRKLREDD